MARKSDLQRNIEGAKLRLESAKEGKYYDVASKTVKTHKDEKKKKKTIKTAAASLRAFDARNRSQTYREGGKVKQGSLAERIGTGIKNRQNFKDRKKAWGVEEARKSYEEDTMKQRMKRTEAKRQAKIKKASKKEKK